MKRLKVEVHANINHIPKDNSLEDIEREWNHEQYHVCRNRFCELTPINSFKRLKEYYTDHEQKWCRCGWRDGGKERVEESC